MAMRLGQLRRRHAPCDATPPRLHATASAVVSCFCALVLLVSGACRRPDNIDIIVVGTLPDGTRYELRLPTTMDAGEVQAVDAVPIWVAWPPGSSGAVGVTNFYRTDSHGPAIPTPDTSAGRASVTDGLLTVRAGRWVMEITLYDYSVGREADLEMILAWEQDELIVLDLPASLRFPEPDQLPRSIEVTYANVRVVRGCAIDIGAVCSPDGQIMVRPTEEGTDLTGVEVRVIS